MGRSEAFDAAIANSARPDRREMVAKHLERLAALVRTHGVADGSLSSDRAVEPGRMDYKVHLVIDKGAS